MALRIIEEANRCLNCKVPNCAKHCPVHTPIPEIIQLFKNGETKEAGRRLYENNPMSVVCATVCNHEAQCMGHCVLGFKGTPVHFYEIEKFISDTYLDRAVRKKPESNGRSIAVIGAGPAGITAAIMLADKGYDVTIFDERDRIGGMLQYGIPDFRLPRSILERYKRNLDEMNIHFRPNTVIGGTIHIDDLFRDGYEAVFIATGVWRPKKLGIHGETLSNVHFGINYLSNPHAYHIGKKVAVIGMGNVAMDVARTAFRNGAESVTLYARGKRIAASEDEVQYTQLDGAEFVFGYAIDSITRKGPVFKVAVFDENDKVIGYEPETVQTEADSTIIAVSQGPKDKLIMTTAGLEGNERGLLIIDDNGMTTVHGVFAAGDVVHGSMTVVHAVEEAKRVVTGMLRYLEEDSAEHNNQTQE